MENKGEQRASKSEHDKIVEGENKMLIQNASKSIYSLTLYGEENCPYTIEANSN